MRYLCLPFLQLSVVIFVIIDISFGSPVEYDQHKISTSVHNIPARPLNIPDVHAITRRAAPDEDKSHLRRKREMLNPTNRPSTALIQRHNHIMDHLQLHAGGSSLAKRSLASDLTVMGFQLLWDHADVIVSSSLAYYRTTEYYKNITTLLGTEFRFGPTVQNFMITYGCFRLMFEPMAEAYAEIRRILFPNGFQEFIQAFAELMLLLTAGVVIGTYQVLAYTVTVSIWITMVIVENARWDDLVVGR